MPHHARGRRRNVPPCASLHADDGIDPRRLARPARRECPDRSTQRLCGQVTRLLTLVLSDLAAGADLPCLDVVRVEPAPDASRLRVHLAALDDRVEGERTLVRLGHERGRLRAELAEHLVRRRVPDLVFAFDAPGAGT